MARFAEGYNGRRIVAVVQSARMVAAHKQQQHKKLADEARREFFDIFTVSEQARLSDEFFITFLRDYREEPE